MKNVPDPSSKTSEIWSSANFRKYISYQLNSENFSIWPKSGADPILQILALSSPGVPDMVVWLKLVEYIDTN